MENRKHQSGLDSVHDTSAFSWGLVVTVAAILAGAALSLLPGMGMSRMVFPGAERVALAVFGFGFSRVFVTRLPSLPGANPRALGGVVSVALTSFRFA